MKKPDSRHPQPGPWRAWRGFSLIELMVAMFLGIIVSAGIITLFTSTSKANRVQAQLARMQEQGRFAVARSTMICAWAAPSTAATAEACQQCRHQRFSGCIPG